MKRWHLIKNREKRKRVAHIVAGITILIHAFEHYEKDHETYIYFAIAGVIVLTVALLHPIIEKRAPWIDGVFFIIEAILSFIVAYDFFHMGKKALPFVYLLLGCFQIVMAFVKSRKGIKEHKLNHSLESTPSR